MTVHEEQEVVLLEDLPTQCCAHTIPRGALIRCFRRPSPNRAYVELLSGEHVHSCHNVKMSKIKYVDVTPK